MGWPASGRSEGWSAALGVLTSDVRRSIGSFSLRRPDSSNFGSPAQHARTWSSSFAMPGTPISGEAPHFDDAGLAAFLADPPEVMSNITRYGGNRFRWEETMNVDELSEAVARRHEGVGQVRELDVVARGPSALVSRAPTGMPTLIPISASGITCTASGVTPARIAPSKKSRLRGA